MNQSKQRLTDYLIHIQQAIERIDRYIEDIDEIVFLNNEMIQDAVIRNFEIIGEASHNVEQHYPKFTADHAELPLASAYQLRNALAHGYFKVDLDLVWKTINSDLPEFYRVLSEIIEKLSNPDSVINLY